MSSSLLCSLTSKLPVDPVAINGAYYERTAAIDKLHESPEFFGFKVVDLDTLKTDADRLLEIEDAVARCTKPKVVTDWNKRRSVCALYRKRSLRIFKKLKQERKTVKPLPTKHKSDIEKVKAVLPIDAKSALDLFDANLRGVETAECYQLLGNILLAMGEKEAAYAAFF